MSIPPWTYEQFSSWTQPLTSPPGPWVIGHGIERDWAECQSDDPSWCDGFCLKCTVTPPDSSPAYHPSFTSNISVNLANYGDATDLAFIWSFWPVYIGTNLTAGTPTAIQTRVGELQYNNTYPASNYNTFNASHSFDNAAKFTHRNHTSVLRDPDGTHGYILLQIAFTMTPLTGIQNEYLNIFVKDIEFTILGEATTAADGGSTGSSVPAGVVAGATVGAVAFVALLILAILFFRRRRTKDVNLIPNPAYFGEPAQDKDRQSPGGRAASGAPPTGMVETSTQQTGSWVAVHSSGKRLNGPSVTPLSTSGDLASASLTGSSRPEGSSTSNALPFTIPANLGHLTPAQSPSVYSDVPQDPPPTYGPASSVRQTAAVSFSAVLALYASQHRDVINESLEARLQVAGYLPTDDPSNLSSDEWQNDYGVTKLELRRLQDLYSQTRQNQAERSQ